MRVHLTAIGGTGMGAVAGLLCEAGHEVRGSDMPLYPPMSTLLQELAVPLFTGYSANNLDWNPELVILGNTCSRTHVEYVAALEREIPVWSFPELLSRQFLAERHPIVVAGTHGKTTTTSLIAHVLQFAGLQPGFLVGGIPANFGRGFALGRPPYFVIEGDEYGSACFDRRPKFAHYRPRTAVLTNVEFDHADIFPHIEAVEAAFAQLVDALPHDGKLIVCASSPRALRLSQRARCPVEVYTVTSADAAGLTTDVSWCGEVSSVDRQHQALGITHVGAPNERWEPIEIPLLGQHNMENALAAAAVGRSLGLPVPLIGKALASFAGVARRQQIRGVVRGITVIDDFAHHPTAIRATLDALRGAHGSGDLIAVFEPRSSTSRRNVFQDDLPGALKHADRVFIAPLFQPEKIPPDERLDLDRVVRDLRAAGRQAQMLPVDEIVHDLVRNAREGDTVVVMSSGGFDGLIGKLLAKLSPSRET